MLRGERRWERMWESSVDINFSRVICCRRARAFQVRIRT